ncbi:Vitamin B12-binding protein [Paenibacillus plantiphilus]|uniref:Vitamin B12-binding protein n=1 Tax=Paenibacillus plantiphilus TaxID=2905650 RepID=A0ABN8GAR1_9BACL|nr:ABC transporter substrate-binding protein [Paenibacillus plantiphilus]CAH1200527.1 Vitamin B12-binding protein [Paenibacillus plantiphilus]
MNKASLFICALLLLAAAGCDGGSMQVSLDARPGDAVLTVTDFAGRQVAFREWPNNIIALTNGETDIIYALGGQLVGRPSSSTPLADSSAEQVTQIGSIHEVDLEQITLLRPDVVLGSDPMNTKDIPVLEGIGSKVILTSANSVDEIKRQITLFGQLLRKEERAAAINKQIEAEVMEYSKLAVADKPRALLIYGAPGTFMAALPNSLSGNILELAGGFNIAADYPRLQSYPQYAQMNTERIVEANPQAVFIMTHGKPEEVKQSFVKEMQTNPAWNNIDAVKQNKVEVLPSDLFGTNPGTRIVDALAFMHDKLAAVRH